ncbi:FadR/GntR family transcriptional regulator [Bauldia sp.]|uniref:FadR/GntR family transcriptional regulator n=1 Tax=Bauldia sp. TaxID=2575872 RepID=UPI003BAD99EF
MDSITHAELPTAPKGSGQRLEDGVYARLLDAIRLGQYSLGQKLPSENELAAEFGVSRPVIRLALSRLREDGLIVSRRGAGSFVSSGTPSEGSGYGPLESIDDIACYFRFRKTVETETVARAAERVDAKGLAELREILEDTDRLIDNGEATIDADIRFHAKIAELSDSRFLVETVGMLRPQWKFIGRFVRSLGRTGYRKGKRDMSAEHGAILNALEAGDTAAAKAAMSIHIDGSERRVFKGE